MSVRKIKWENKGGTSVRFVVDYADASGKRRNKQFKTKKEADAFELTARSQVRDGTHTPESQSITVAEAGALWVAGVKRNERERSTSDQYQSWLTHHIEPLLGAEKLSRLTMPRVQKFADDLLDQGRSKAMAGKALSGLRMLLRSAMKTGLVAQNVAVGVTVVRSAREKEEIVVPTREELKKILDATAEGFPLKWRVAVLLDMVTGLRISELRGLRWVDVDLRARTVSVRQRADQWSKIGPCKSKAALRTLPLPEEVVAELTAWKLASKFAKDADLVFPNSRGGVQGYSNFINRVWDPLLVKAKIAEPFGFHGLRHAAASNWIDLGMNWKRLKTWMGHSTVKITIDTYGHLIADAEADQKLAAGSARGLF